eukprot:4049163-Heterocapsa_arctica.AAC.1
MRHGRADVLHLGPLPFGRVVAPDRLGVARERVEHVRAIALRGRDIDGMVVAVPAGVRETTFALSFVVIRAAPQLRLLLGDNLSTGLRRGLSLGFARGLSLS